MQDFTKRTNLWNNTLTHKQKENLNLKFQVNLSYFSVENKVTYF